MSTISFKELETKLLSLMKGQYSSLYLSFNEDSASNKRTVQQEWDTHGEFSWDPISEENQLVCIESNSVWSLTWFPNSPVGSHSVGASTLSLLLGYVFGEEIDASGIEQLLKSKMTGEYPTVEIEYNDNACSYRSAKDTIENPKINDVSKYEFTWVTPEEEKLTIDKNSLWAYNQFIRNPGDVKLNASSLEVILDYLKNPQ